MSNSFQICRAVRDSFILNIRRLFSGDSKYPYVETITGEYAWDSTKLIISDTIPQEHAFFPAIVVDAVSGPETRYLGPDDLQEDFEDGETQSDQIFASFDLTVNIKIYTIDDTIARDEIADRIYDHLKTTTDDLAAAGIEIKRATFTPDAGREFRDNRWYITSQLTFDVYKEWSEDIGVGDIISAIQVELTLQP